MEYIVSLADNVDMDRFEALFGTNGELIRCKDCKWSDTFKNISEETTTPLKCIGIRYGGVFPDWFCEHAERKEG